MKASVVSLPVSQLLLVLTPARVPRPCLANSVATEEFAKLPSKVFPDWVRSRLTARCGLTLAMVSSGLEENEGAWGHE